MQSALSVERRDIFPDLVPITPRGSILKVGYFHVIYLSTRPCCKCKEKEPGTLISILCMLIMSLLDSGEEK